MKPVGLAILEEVFTHMHLNGVGYSLGAKAPSMTCDSSQIHKIDCSGFVRYAIARATEQAVVMPDGSVNQHDWCDSQKLPKLAYPNVGKPDATGKLFIGFIQPAHGHPGHVWLVHNATTLESHGGVGVDSRPWNSRVLVNAVAACYELPCE